MKKMSMNNPEGKKLFTRQVGAGLVELLFPARKVCPVCQQEESYRNGLGKKCFRKISLVYPPICAKCGRPKRLEAIKQELCKECAETGYYFSKARAVGLYEGILREILADLKYRYRPDLGNALGMLLVEWIKLHHDFQKFDLLIPVPIHYRKLAARGYNQVDLLAGPLEKYLGIPLKKEMLVREKITESQNELNREERFLNIDGAFRVIDTQSLGGARVLLVDDILTTGATASEASRVLLRAGAQDVKVLTLAVGVIDSQWLKI